uniref:Olfactory receptor 6M1-like n=1 Tax=Nothoprocta perdicaria TaxID=30464 RepID=A0A8C7A223_NOTPE
MYYFLSNLSFIEVSMTSSAVPKMLANLLSEKKTISFGGCFSQLYFYFSPAATEFILFAIMSYDRYVAICNPLRYPTIMTERVCGQLLRGAWVGGMVLILPLVVLKVAELRDFVVSVLLLLGSLALTVFSYACIILTILQIPSAQGRQKTFATCASHFTVVSLGFGISICIYVRPPQMNPGHLIKILSVLSSIVTPLLIPFIFSLRNQQMKEAWENALHNCLGMAEEARKP